MKKNKEDREMFFDNQAYFSNPMMGGIPFQSSNMMYYNPNMMPYQVQYPASYNTCGYDNNLEERVNKLERVVRRLEESINRIENKLGNNSNYQTTNNNFSTNDTYMV